MSDLSTVLDYFREHAGSEREKGELFERLMQAYLRIDPVFADQFSDVWLWAEYPDRGNRPDTGIDLVARDATTGHDVAIQCKFFAPKTTVTKPMIDSFLAASGREGFAERIIISTSDRWAKNAEDAIKDQAIPVRRIGLSDLEASRIDWSTFDPAAPAKLSIGGPHSPRPHQQEAIDVVRDSFAEVDRGRLIMACGTGKTFTSLRLAEQVVGLGGTVLFLVPSISLLAQTVREWMEHASIPIRALAVCSDPKTTKRRQRDASEDISVTDLALPATTDVAVLRKRLDAANADGRSMTVIFATYQSIDVVAQAQSGREPIGLIVADEAHRTTGATLAGKSESAFVRVHDNSYLPAIKRLYMTATPRIYDDSTKAKAGQANAVLASMDDEAVYGPEMHRLGFGQAVERGLLTDYKVLVLTVDEASVARTFQEQLSDESHELKLDDAAKIVGCWNGLAKRGSAEHSFEPDVEPMRRALAFAGSIKDSKRIEELFQSVTDHYASAASPDAESDEQLLRCSVQHVDGTMNALERNGKLDWLKEDPGPGRCRILTNARCLSEGVDVPSLDAVMFLSPRKSAVDIVQAVGRVMRLDKSSGKQFGYIILPIGIPEGVTPEEALKDNKRYAVVWEVLQALRAHDERFDALINRIQLSKNRDPGVNVIGVGGGTDTGGVQMPFDLVYPEIDELRDAIYARVVQKVGSREYWTDWAKDVADIARRQTTRITALLSSNATPEVRDEFDRFLHGLRGNLNEGVTESDAVEMLAQHLITRPVFSALFEGSDFLDGNPVAEVMERMLAVLDQHDLAAENESLSKFYDSVRRKVADVRDPEGRQELIRRLYDTFFSTAFKKTSDKLGIVYTPVEIVDFILRSADEVLHREFGQRLTDEGIHILDGFTGTGTFIARLLELGVISTHDLARKYATELHANEILLLPYYIAAVNIETTYLGIRRQADPAAEYKEFPGLVLADTFQSWEDEDHPDLDVFPENNERLERLKGLPITVIVGNPPYSAGQASANDDNQNDKYPSLDAEIARTFAARSSSSLHKSLYDSYVRALKWATLRIGARGIVAYVTNGGFIDSNTADGLRLCLADECSDIYVFNLRGNSRTAGEAARREGGQVFGGRVAVAVTVLVKNPAKAAPATIHYAEVGDSMSRADKLAAVSKAGSIFGIALEDILPNSAGDWINQRRDDFASFLPLGDRQGGRGIFDFYSTGISSHRDAWVWNFSDRALRENVKRTISLFNSKAAARDTSAPSPTDIKWSRKLEGAARAGKSITYDDAAVVSGLYRPFTREWVYSSPELIDESGQVRLVFPRGEANQALGAMNPGGSAPFACLAVDQLPDLTLAGAGNPVQLFPRWRFPQPAHSESLDLFKVGAEPGRVDNISDFALDRFTSSYGAWVSKDDIFHYVYGVLSCPEYRSTYEADLRRVLPRIPLVGDPRPFIDAGQALLALHTGFDRAAPYPLLGLDSEPVGDAFAYFAVQKMAFGKGDKGVKGRRSQDRSVLVYNANITLSEIPDDAHRFYIGSRTALEWIIDRYQVKSDKASGIVNDPNAWSRESGNPRYVIDLVARIVTVSLRTMQILDALPPLEIIGAEQTASA